LGGGIDSPQWPRASSITRFLDHTQRRTTVGGTPLDEWSPRSRDLYLTTHNTHNRQASMPPSRGIRTHNLSRRAAAELRLRPRGHWHRIYLIQPIQISYLSIIYTCYLKISFSITLLTYLLQPTLFATNIDWRARIRCIPSS